MSFDTKIFIAGCMVNLIGGMFIGVFFLQTPVTVAELVTDSQIQEQKELVKRWETTSQKWESNSKQWEANFEGCMALLKGKTR